MYFCTCANLLYFLKSNSVHPFQRDVACWWTTEWIKPCSLCSLHPIPFNLPNMYCHMQSWMSLEQRYLLTFLLILVQYSCLLFFVFSLWLPIDIIRLNLCLMISPALFLRCISLKPYSISCSLKFNWENLGTSNDCSHLIASCGVSSPMIFELSLQVNGWPNSEQHEFVLNLRLNH